MRMKKIFLTGSTQIVHIAELLTENGYETQILPCNIGTKKNLLRYYWELLCYYWKYIFALWGNPQVYIVYAMPNDCLTLILARMFRKKVILHWIGTDVYNYTHKLVSTKPYTGNVSHVAGSPLLCSELKAVGIDAKMIPIVPFGMKLELMEMPEKHAALVYLPKGREDFYRGDIVRELALRNPDIQFHIVANDGYASLQLSNVVFHGRLSAEEMNALYSEISILVRIPEHDGLSMMVLEALAKGKQVLYRYEHPFVYTPDTLAIEDIDAKFKEIIAEKPKQNVQGHNYIYTEYTEDNMMQLYKKYHIFD